MKRLLILLAAMMLAGCALSPSPETTVPETTIPESSAPEITAQTRPQETTVSKDPLDIVMESMSLEQKVGQLFIVAPEQILPDAGQISSMTDALGEAISRCPVGGFILFRENIQSPEQIAVFTQALQDASDIPLFLAVDEEGGLVSRLAGNPGFELPTYKSTASVASSGDPEDAHRMGSTIGTYLLEYGFNLNFAPVADVNTNPQNPIIGTRAFSPDPETAAIMASAYAEGLRENGIIATFKHFPGHGDTAQDSHSGLAVSYRTREELESCEWLPFREATQSDMVMIGHIALPEITGELIPATLSREIVTEILRCSLGFEGLIITDAMQMGAITESYSTEEATVAALLAGCNIILMPENPAEAFTAVIAALEDGRLTMDWLDETVRRILEFKQQHGLLAF